MAWSLSSLLGQDTDQSPSHDSGAQESSLGTALGDGMSAALLASAGGLGNAGMLASLGLGLGRRASGDDADIQAPAPQLEHELALEKVKEMIAGGRAKGYTQAADNLQHWLDGTGADKEMPTSLFTDHKKFLKHLRGKHRDEFEAGAKRRIEDGTLTDGGTALMTWQDSMTATLFTDLYYALGGFTIDSTVVVKATKTEDGQWSVSYENWGVQISDRYNWDVGKKTLVLGIGIVEDSELKALEREGYGKSYDISAGFVVEDADALAEMEIEAVVAE